MMKYELPCCVLLFFTPTTLVVGQAINFSGNRGVNRSCVAKGGGPGECRELFSCPAVVATFRRTRPAICGFRGAAPIVCCPRPSSREQPKPTASHPSISPPKINFECGRRHGQTRPPVRGDVVGGKEATPNSWPWMAAVGRLKHRGQITWVCDGILITPKYVLSAAHCVTHSAVDLVRLGAHNLQSAESSQVDIRVMGVVLHPQYRAPAATHDLALLRLDRSAPISLQISPVCLPWNPKDAPPLGHGLVLAGWGATEFGGDLSDVLREVVVTLFPTSQCDAAYRRLFDYTTRFPSGVDSNFLCAGSRFGGKDACQTLNGRLLVKQWPDSHLSDNDVRGVGMGGDRVGVLSFHNPPPPITPSLSHTVTRSGDSGGPVVYNVFGKYMLAGVVTAGYGCGQAAFPGIYAAATAHLQWIKNVAFSQYM